MGLIHIYCGDGKGKTTAAMGLSLRAAGSGMRVHIIQLLKGNPTSELNSLALIPNITVSRPDKNYGFTFKMSEENKQLLTECHNEMLIHAEKLMHSGEIDMLVIDEFNAAYKYGLIDYELADRIVLQKPDDTELVLTGRNPAEKFVKAADYVSEIVAVKHPYSEGINARKGIEF
jgi:cob(I)alamin adenosyltransferase